MQSRDCVAHSQNLEIELAFWRLHNTCAQSGDYVSFLLGTGQMPHPVGGDMGIHDLMS